MARLSASNGRNSATPRSKTTTTTKQHKKASSGVSKGVKPAKKRTKARESNVTVEDLEESDGQDEVRNYQYLKPVVRQVSTDKIKDAWRQLQPPAVQRLRGLLVTAKRGVVNTAKSSKGLEERSAAVDKLTGYINKRIPRMFVPPGTKEEHVDLEKLLEKARLLESQLTATLHSVQLIKDTIKREELALDEDVKELASLEFNAASEEKFWKQQDANRDATIDLDREHDFGDSPDEIGLVAQNPIMDSIFDDEEDEDLGPILLQLRSHLESIHANGMQVQGLPDTLSDASIALEGVP